MPTPKIKKRIGSNLVANRLEKVSKDLFRKYYELITDLVSTSPGGYALYDGDALYYVGKSIDLKKRVKQHLRDRHLNSWTHFSFYLIRKVQHINEIESLLVRIASPKGNRVTPAGRHRGPLLNELKRMIRQKQRQELSDLFGESTIRTPPNLRRSVIAQRTLVGLVSRRKGLYRNYKGKRYSATLFSNGTIIMGKKKYFSPTAAAKVVVDRSQVNGWNFWYIKDVNGDKIKLSKYAEQISGK
jgi:hypothetical protein